MRDSESRCFAGECFRFIVVGFHVSLPSSPSTAEPYSSMLKFLILPRTLSERPFSNMLADSRC